MRRHASEKPTLNTHLSTLPMPASFDYTGVIPSRRHDRRRTTDQLARLLDATFGGIDLTRPLVIAS